MSISAQENERRLLELFPLGTRFNFGGIEYESTICGKPRVQGGGGEPITDMYLDAEPTDANADNLILQISLKRLDWEFVKNHMQNVDFTDVFFTEHQSEIQNYLRRANQLVNNIPVIDLGGNGPKINARMGEGSITLGWEMMITNANRGLSLGILSSRFVREAVLGEHIEQRRRHASVNGNIIHDSGIPTHVLVMDLDGHITRDDVFQTMITSDEFVQSHQNDLRVILKANNYRSLSNRAGPGRSDGQRYLFIQNRWSARNGCLERELIVDVGRAFETNQQSRESLEDALNQLGIDIENVNLADIPLCEGVPENHQ